jgi:hypothetical protein
MVRTIFFSLALTTTTLAQSAASDQSNVTSSSQKSIQPTPKLLSAALASSTETSPPSLSRLNEPKPASGKCTRAWVRLAKRRAHWPGDSAASTSLSSMANLPAKTAPRDRRASRVGENVGYNAAQNKSRDASDDFHLTARTCLILISGCRLCGILERRTAVSCRTSFVSYRMSLGFQTKIGQSVLPATFRAGVLAHITYLC